MTEFQNIKRLISNNELEKAIDLILEIANEINYTRYTTEAILYSARYKQNKESYLGRLIKDKEHTRERTIITIWANNFLTKVDEELRDDSYQEFIFEKSKYNSYEDFKNGYLNKLEVPKPIIHKKTVFESTRGRKKILFLSANPESTARLKLDDEYRLISDRMYKNEFYDLLKPQLALTIENLIIAMNQRPQIVHFAGHGKRNAIIISNGNDKELEMPTRALKRLFRQHKEDLKLVVLNACYSAKQAKALSELGFYVIGMNNVALDDGSVDFASGLYIGLSEGKNIEKAFDDAMIVIEAKHSSFADLPEIWKDGEKLDL